MKRKRWIVPLLACILLWICGCSRAKNEGAFSLKQHETEHLTEQELTKVRSYYPQNDTQNSIGCGVSGIEMTYEEWFSQESITDIAVLRLVGDWYDAKANTRLTDDAALNEKLEQAAPEIRNMVYPVIDAVVEETIWSDSGTLQKGDRITLHFGYAGRVIEQKIDKICTGGNTYVFLMQNREGKTNLKIKDLYSSTKTFIYYLTEDQALLSVSSLGAGKLGDGLYLDHFINLVQDVRAEAAAASKE